MIPKNLQYLFTGAILSLFLAMPGGAAAVVLVDSNFDSDPSQPANSPSSSIQSGEVGAGWFYDVMNDEDFPGDFIDDTAGSGTTVPSSVFAWGSGGAVQPLGQVVQDNQATTGVLDFEFTYTAVDTDGNASLDWEIFGLTGTYEDFNIDRSSDPADGTGWSLVDSGTVSLANLNSSFDASAGDTFPSLLTSTNSVDFGSGYDFLGVRFNSNGTSNTVDEFSALGSATIIPEPNAAALLLLGLGAFLLARRRRG